MHNSHSFSSKPVRASSSSSKRTSTPSAAAAAVTTAGQEQQWQYPAGYDYQSYYAAWQSYQSQHPYYSYDQSYAGYGGSYQYQPSHFPSYQAYAAQSSTEDGQHSATTEAEQNAAIAQYYSYFAYDADNIIEEHDIPLNVEKLNEETLLRNDDLYDSLEDSRWLPMEGVDTTALKSKA